MTSTVKPRRKPSQSRAWMTSVAIQDAFLLLLIERGYAKTTMREIAAVAGVGLGTLYLYFPGKESIAAVTIRTRLRKLTSALSEAARAAGSASLVAMVRILAAVQVQALCSERDAWRALLFLERRISAPASYRTGYMEYVAVWRDAFAAASDWPRELAPGTVASQAFAIVDGMTQQALLVQDGCPQPADLLADVEAAVAGYLRGVQARVRPAARAG
jgi:AcrR family transcriptional regulator